MNKQALLIGINYTGSQYELNGCINDINNMKALLVAKFGYLPENIVTMTDFTELKPTRINILKELLALIVSGKQDLYFHYSGHGSHMEDLSGDETDRRDETLVPLDYETAGLITDDELRGLLECVTETEKLTMVLDCCHSGTGVDLKYNLYERVNTFSMLADPSKKYSQTRGQVVCVSGCMDHQTSADAYISGQSQGALTYSLIKALNSFVGRNRTYNNVYKSMRSTLLVENHAQIPCLSSGRELNLNMVMNL